MSIEDAQAQGLLAEELLARGLLRHALGVVGERSDLLAGAGAFYAASGDALRPLLQGVLQDPAYQGQGDGGANSSYELARRAGLTAEVKIAEDLEAARSAELEPRAQFVRGFLHHLTGDSDSADLDFTRASNGDVAYASLLQGVRYDTRLPPSKGFGGGFNQAKFWYAKASGQGLTLASELADAMEQADEYAPVAECGAPLAPEGFQSALRDEHERHERLRGAGNERGRDCAGQVERAGDSLEYQRYESNLTLEALGRQIPRITRQAGLLEGGAGLSGDGLLIIADLTAATLVQPCGNDHEVDDKPTQRQIPGIAIMVQLADDGVHVAVFGSPREREDYFEVVRSVLELCPGTGD